jgi:hypothetical protein
MKTTIDMAETISHGWWLDDEKLKAFEALVRADEREACAKVCEETLPTHPDLGVICAAAIRNRGNT